MSRIGKAPVVVPGNVAIKVGDNNVVSVKGPLGEMSHAFDPAITIKLDGEIITLERHTNNPRHRSLHGLYRSLINNMVSGVSTGFKTEQELVGVGYRAEVRGNILDLSLGYSHNYIIELPSEIKAESITEKGKNPRIIMNSHDRQLLGQVAAKIRSLRKPEPYKGKGIKFTGEVLRRKAGKSAGKGK
jgi:large subunit ribosomal protein L6